MNKEKLYGIKQEILGLKNAIDELQVVVSQIGSDMAMLQRKIIGMEMASGINGSKEFIRKTTKKGNTLEKRNQPENTEK